MGSSIQFDATQVLGRLDAIRSTQIRYAGGQALKQLGWDLRQHHQQWIKGGGFENPVPFTVASPRYTPNGLELRFFINPDGTKGQSPATYLYPVSTVGGTGRKTVFETLFAKALHKRGITTKHPIPYTRGGNLRLNKYGNVTPGEYQAVLAGLARDDGSYISVPDNRKARAAGTGLKPGIYRRKGMKFLFGYVDVKPTVATKYDWFGITDRYAKQHFPALLSEALEKALR